MRRSALQSSASALLLGLGISEKLSALAGDLPTLADATIIEDWTATGAESSKTFTVPNTYTHLKLTIIGRTQRAVTVGIARIRPNNDSSSSSYNFGEYNLTNATLGGAYRTTETGIGCFLPGTSYGISADCGMSETYFYHYNNTQFWKHMHSRANFRDADSGANTNLYHFFARWRSTAAITSIFVGDPTPGNFVAGTRMLLEGL